MDSLRKLLVGNILGVCMLMPLGASAGAVYEVPPNPIAGDIFSDGDFIMDAFDAAAYGAEIRFPYMSDKVYKIYAQPGFVTDIVLEKNEKITYVGGGDTARWKVDTSAVGSPYESYCHLYLKPLSDGITTDFIINTDKRVYRLMVTSGSRYNAVVRWLYDETSGNQKEMGFLDKFKKKKNPLYDNNTPKYDGYEEDLSDDGSAGLDVYNDPAEPRDFNTESSTVEKPKISEYESSLNEFERLNNDQLDPQSKTSMKHKKEKTLYSTLVKAFRKAKYNANNSAKNGADVAKSFEIRNSTKTAEEKHFRGLKKTYLYVAIGIFLILVGMSLLFANNDDPYAPKNASQDPKAVSNGADIRPTDNKTAEARNIALHRFIRTYTIRLQVIIF